MRAPRGNEAAMKFRRTIRREIDHEKDGVSVKGGVNAVIAMNVNEKGSVSSVSSKQRIVQRSSRSNDAEPKEGGES